VFEQFASELNDKRKQWLTTQSSGEPTPVSITRSPSTFNLLQLTRGENIPITGYDADNSDDSVEIVL